MKLIPICVLLFFAVVNPSLAQQKRAPQKIEREGVEVEFTIEPIQEPGKSPELMEAKEATVRFKIQDKASKTPLSGVKPSVWLTQRGENITDEQACREKVQSFLQGSLRSRPDVDLNAYYVLALNEEANISVIDPLLGFGSSKLLTLVMLKSPGEDWVQKSSEEKLFVSMPAANQIAVVDTNTWKVVANIDTGMKPARIRLQPDERYLWVGNDAAESGKPGGVTVIDTTTLKVVAQLPTGNGHHEIDFSSDNRFAFVTNEQDGTLTVIDIQKLTKFKDLKTGTPATSIAFSTIGKALYLVNEVDGSITVVDARRHEIETRIQAKPGIRNVRFAPGGRWGFVPNPKENVVYVFDASTNRLAHTISVDKGPDQVAFTDTFAYLRSTGSTEVSLVRLSTLTGQPDIAKFPGGQNAPAEASLETIADAIVPAPEGNSVLVANPADRIIYYYSEGMAAPMGSFQNYRRKPRGLMVVDRSLREVSSGVYSTTTKLPKSGKYDVAFLLDSPRITHCFNAEAKPNPDVPREKQVAIKIEYLNQEKQLRVGENYKLRFKVIDSTTLKAKNDLQDLRVLTLLSSGIWQKRDFARPVGDGVYELEIKVPQSGAYFVFVESRSQGVSFRQLPSLTLKATAVAATHHNHAQLKTYSCPMHPDVTSKKKGRCPKCGMDLRPADPANDPAKKDLAESTVVADNKLNIPDVELVDQNGRKIHFYSDLVKGQTVAINFIFTTCTTICPPLGATFARVQKELGDRAGRDVRFISISVDPATDTPERLKAWGAKFKAGESWTFVTGPKPKIDELLNALGVSSARREDHSPTILIGNDASGTWTRTYGLTNVNQIVELINRSLGQS